MRPRGGEINNIIEAWRFFFTIVICMLHWESAYMNGEQPYFECGYLAVEFFFVLSGFFLMRSATVKSETTPTEAAWRYTIKRVKRFYPWLLFSWILVIANIIAANAWPVWKVFSLIKKYMMEFFLLSAAGATEDVLLYQGWYISALIICGYFIYFFVQYNKELYIGLVGPVLFMCVFTYQAVGGYGIDTHYGYQVISLGAANRAVAGLSLGCIWYYLQVEKKIFKININLTDGKRGLSIRKWGGKYNVVECIVLIALCMILFKNQHGKNNLGIYIVVLFLLFFANEKKTIISCTLDRPIFGYIGRLCLPMYLNQYLIINRCIVNFGHTSYMYDAILYIGISICCATAEVFLFWACKNIAIYVGKNRREKL